MKKILQRCAAAAFLVPATVPAHVGEHGGAGLVRHFLVEHGYLLAVAALVGGLGWLVRSRRS